MPKQLTFSLALIAVLSMGALYGLASYAHQHLPHSEDEVAYLFQAQVMALGRLSVPTPENPAAFWSPFVIDYGGQRFGKYSPGWPAMLSLGVFLGQPWLINALLASATLVMIGWLGWHCFGDQRVSLWSVGLGLACPGYLMLSSSLLSHTASLFWATIALCSLVAWISSEEVEQREAQHANQADKKTRWVEERSSTYGLSLSKATFCATWVGVAFGVAFLIRPFGAVGVAAPCGIFLLYALYRQHIRLGDLCVLIASGLLTSSLLPLFWWAITGEFGFNAYTQVWPYDHPGFGPEIGHSGYDLYTAWLNTRLKLSALGTGLFGWPSWMNIIPLSLAILGLINSRARQYDLLWLGVILGLVGVHIFYWAFGGVDGGFPRYYYDALPALLLLSARGIVWAQEQLAVMLTRQRLQHVITSFVLLGVSYNLSVTLPMHIAEQRNKYGISDEALERWNDETRQIAPTLQRSNTRFRGGR